MMFKFFSQKAKSQDVMEVNTSSKIWTFLEDDIPIVQNGVKAWIFLNKNL